MPAGGVRVGLAALALAVALALAGCATYGPGRVEQDRSDYSGALSASWVRETLLGIVRMRYGELPVFLNLSGIVAGYTFSIGGNASWDGGNGLRGLFESLSPRGRYEERPTISYKPMAGRSFVNTLMVPLPPETVISLITSGWSPETVFRTTIAEMNGLRNPGRAGGDPGSDNAREFDRVLVLLGKLHAARNFAIGLKSNADGDKRPVLSFRMRDSSARLAEETAELKRLLRLAPDASEVDVHFGQLPGEPGLLAIRTRPMLEILALAAQQVRVPAAHVADGRVDAGASDTVQDPIGGSADRLVIHSQAEAPVGAYASVRYRGHWYWIDDRDLASKQALSFMLLLFSMAETDRDDSQPLLTLPTR